MTWYIDLGLFVALCILGYIVWGLHKDLERCGVCIDAHTDCLSKASDILDDHETRLDLHKTGLKQFMKQKVHGEGNG